MLGKLLKNDLRRNMRWLWVLFVCAIVAAGISRGCAELGKSLAFFKILTIVFDTVFYALLANTIIQPFLRNFLNFSKSLYGDESYLTHTLPVTKNQIINSKFLTAIIEITLGFVCIIISILIKFGSPTMFETLKAIMSSIIIGEFSIYFVIALFIILVIVEFLMFISIIYFAIVMGYKSNEKKVLKSFLYTGLMAIVALTILSIVMLIVLVINGVDISAEALTLSGSAFISIMLTGIIVYTLLGTLFYFLAKKEFNKGVNVD